ncbi:hypothetical protein GF336_02130 [Candidatus Woesearchaeota archaeon]|nr:hypothetical protein [Candidatus Woesearchaeota archaeon]
MKKEITIALLFIFILPIVIAETESPVGTFNVGNSAPPAPSSWTPETTHNKSQIFSWTEGSDVNGDPISTYICISADTDDDSCDVVNTGPDADPQYAFTQLESNWDYTWGTASRNYYVKLVPNDGTTNGTANTSISFTLTDALPTISGQTSDASNDGDKDVGETITFSMSSHSDTDSEDAHNLRVCSTNSIDTDGTCTADEYCNEHNSTYSDDSSLSCTYTAQQSDSTSNTAYFFVCDCPPDDNSCPGQCSSSYSHTFYVNHAPSASSVEISPSTPSSSQDLTCTYSFSDSDTDSEGSSTFRWYKDGVLQGGITTVTIDSSNTAADEEWICEITPKDQHGLAGTAVNSSSVTITNSAPSISGFEVQDGASSWDSAGTPDTHDSTPNLRWATFDNDGDDVTTHICIATSSGKRDSNNCDAYSSTSSSDDVSAVSGIFHSGTSRTYYLRLTPDDGSENGTPLDTSFNLINSIPSTPSSLSPLSTHNPTPTLSWTATDADDGTDDHWPADSLTYHIRVGTSYGDGTYESNDNADKAGETVDSAIPWGTPSGDYANNTVYASIWTTDGNTGGTSDYYNTTLTLYDSLPDITDISMTDNGGAYSSCTSSSCALTPIEHSNAAVAVKVTAEDADNDCDTSSTAYIYLCLDTGSCFPSTADYSWELDSIERSGSECTYTFSANKTDGPEFFQSPNSDYKIYANVSSQAGQRLADPEIGSSWEFGTVKAVDYPSIITLGDGSPSLGQWNDGTSLATMTNWGNDNLNIQWNISDPTSGTDTWTLNGTDMQIDDDNSYSSESGTIAPVYLDSTQRTFEPASGLQVCSSSSCDNPALDETLDTYYHIAPPFGLQAGTYNATITITIS